ncbi:hypothetical protein SPRG_17094 [Saprolegnia parasitica CBS 223.65]|uniref:Uncharacterized protein n=1 Tax=Saprolegnia parasitica (strain CBS 223.65) TaxID=695850 RepID=A0A067BH38_SAPPC|nr:hypothetical protein SPRG_17094 [Saprolegnia parasitica CBS 223.65]KDO17488.1 hypothetical protein SPRG_17094 [Saprolegnia parasitica CBS 223.65]|eukprot:XP_012211805.1 hypothetical protein SPRG_17094 [Saprolegnia parasitica CBS 223.65]
MGTSQSSEANGVLCSSCNCSLPPNQYTFFNWHNAVCNLYAFYDVAGDKKIIKYVRIANEDKCYNCLRLHAAGVGTLYGIKG